MSSMTGVVHIHSDYSHDGRDSLGQLQAFGAARGLGFIAMTDHAEDFSEDIWGEYVEHCAAASEGGVRIIPGLEFRFAGFRGLHLLAFGLTRWIEPRTPEEFVTLAGAHARCTGLAHPVLASYAIPECVLQGIDAVEVWNATYNTRYLPDPRAFRLLQRIRRSRPDVVGFAGLDQHDSRNDRQTRIVLRDGSAEPIAAMRAGAFHNVGRTMRFDSGDGIAGARLALLGLGRAVYDRVEHAQDSMARALRSRRGAG